MTRHVELAAALAAHLAAADTLAGDLWRLRKPDPSVIDIESTLLLVISDATEAMREAASSLSMIYAREDKPVVAGSVEDLARL